MDKFHVGQKVRVIRSMWCPGMVGEVVTILEPRKVRRNNVINPSNPAEWVGYRADCKEEYDPFCPREENLAPIYDGDQASSWEECEKLIGWRPDKVNA